MVGIVEFLEASLFMVCILLHFFALIWGMIFDLRGCLSDRMARLGNVVFKAIAITFVLACILEVLSNILSTFS